MAQNYYLVRCNGLDYANEELFTVAVAKGERAFIKMLAGKTVSGERVLGEMLYPLTAEQQLLCEAYQPVRQDFDDAFKHFNIVSRRDVEQIKGHCSAAFPDAQVIVISRDVLPGLFKYRQAVFFKVRDYREARKYYMVLKMASIKICGCLYVALNAVDVRVEMPIIVTLGR